MTAPPRLSTRTSRLGITPLLGGALLASLGIHLLLLGFSFKLPPVREENFLSPPLEVVLVNSKSARKPLQADALAQANLDGGGNTDLDRRAKSPLPATAVDQRESGADRAQQRVRQLEAQARQIMTRLKSEQSLPNMQNATSPTDAKPVEADPRPISLVARSLEMAKLEAQISREYDAYQKRPKRMFIGARTQDYVFARYIEDWRIKVERIGNQNYPAAARSQKLYGKLQLTVSIKSDGSLDDVEVTRGSGSKILDAAAVAIVREAAPYSPFPEEMRNKADILSITRTWNFIPGDQLSSND
ncbi:energry transducer TonB [Sulfuriferula plumbiphila]|uniref:Energry transducer TonB n=1 Tax=Sulfuriferula plumbiphila TaxID=171865 RepID=A0A512L369_9PROT|nr:energy transducer TonB [Sulfuriferula plumbiphila]BBP02626.1 energry transducer TonB [Sulfuriferula plumbiphila]GEP28920.1 energry transducer TonB [Sulfuriferula plumbiphila]